MVYKKEWLKIKRDPNVSLITHKYSYTGYFLLGFIPIYIKRETLYDYQK